MAGVVLHGTSAAQQGIPECWRLKKEFDKCYAWDLSPPAKIPTEQEQRKAEEARKAAEEARKEEEKQKNKAEEDERAENKEAGTLGLTEEMDLVTLTSRNEPGVSAGSSEEDPVAKAAREREERLRSLSRETMGRVHFCNIPDDLVRQSQSDMQNNARAFVVVEAATTSVNGFAHMLADAKRLTDLYLAGSGNGGNDHQYKIRVLLLVGCRHELIAMAEDMGSWLWPQWNQTVVQSKKRDIQSHRIAPVPDVPTSPLSLPSPKSHKQ